MGYIGTVERDFTRDEWLERRRACIGGSDAPGLAGASEWSSAMSVYLDKLGLSEYQDSEPAEWGRRLESAVIEKVEDVTGRFVNERQAVYVHPEHEWMLATIDGKTKDEDGRTILFEGKTTGAWRAKTWHDDLPLTVWVQCQHNMAVTELPAAIVAVLIGGQKFELHHVDRDDAYIAQLIELERDFYENHLVPQIPPPIDGSKASEKALAILFPEDDGSELTTDDPALEMAARRYLDYKVECARAEKEKRAAANELRALIGEHESATIGGKYRATWKTIQRDA